MENKTAENGQEKKKSHYFGRVLYITDPIFGVFRCQSNLITFLFIIFAHIKV